MKERKCLFMDKKLGIIKIVVSGILAIFGTGYAVKTISDLSYSSGCSTVADKMAHISHEAILNVDPEKETEFLDECARLSE